MRPCALALAIGRAPLRDGARILATALECERGPTAEPYLACPPRREIGEGADIDVLEINGATYTGIDKVRELQGSLPYGRRGTASRSSSSTPRRWPRAGRPSRPTWGGPGGPDLQTEADVAPDAPAVGPTCA